MGDHDHKSRTRSWWGWGWEDEALTADQTERLAASITERFGLQLDVRPPPTLDGLDLATPRVPVPSALSGIFSTDTYDRAGHTYGKAFRDVVRGSYGELADPPDAVAFPTTEADVVSILDWA